MRGNADGKTKRQLLSASTVIRSRERRRNMGEPERRVWRALREAFPDIRFRRHVPFGPYHADFCCHAVRLIVEIDGDTHASTADRDAHRTRFLNDEGYRVLRFSNTDIMDNIDGVIQSIGNAMFPDMRKGRP